MGFASSLAPLTLDSAVTQPTQKRPYTADTAAAAPIRCRLDPPGTLVSFAGTVSGFYWGHTERARYKWM